MNMVILKGPNGIRLVHCGEPYRRQPDEAIIGSAAVFDPDTIRKENEQIGLGDLVGTITKTTGFKKWWDEKHGGECSSCKKRQAAMNYIKFKGPSWMNKWVKGHNR